MRVNQCYGSSHGFMACAFMVCSKGLKYISVPAILVVYRAWHAHSMCQRVLEEIDRDLKRT